jgi:hypothetical protein
VLDWITLEFIVSYDIYQVFPLPHGTTAPSRPGSPHFWGFTITLSHTTIGRNPLDEWSARRRYLSVTTHNTHKRRTFLPRRNLYPTIPESERPPTGICIKSLNHVAIFAFLVISVVTIICFCCKSKRWKCVWLRRGVYWHSGTYYVCYMYLLNQQMNTIINITGLKCAW